MLFKCVITAIKTHYKRLNKKKEMTKTVPIYIALIVCLCLVSCGAEINMKKGEKLWQLGEYFSAAEQFKKAYTKTPS